MNVKNILVGAGLAGWAGIIGVSLVEGYKTLTGNEAKRKIENTQLQKSAENIKNTVKENLEPALSDKKTFIKWHEIADSVRVNAQDSVCRLKNTAAPKMYKAATKIMR